MKKIFGLIAIVFLFTSTQAQTDTSKIISRNSVLEIEKSYVLTTQQQIDDINLRLFKYSKQKTTSNSFLVAGMMTSVVGILMFAGSSSGIGQGDIPVIGVAAAVIGPLLINTSLIINLSSHRKLLAKKKK